MAIGRYDLNDISASGLGKYDWSQRQRTATSGKVTVHFGDVASAAQTFIEGSDAIVGCVAWVKSPRLVEVLAQRPVALVVNKEFGLRVDGHHERTPLLRLNGGLPSTLVPVALRRAGAKLDPVRCVGWAARGRIGALMHHKFMVRLTKGPRSYTPTAVWTGSFNLTSGAERNIENGMVIADPALARAYLEEFARVYAVSEPLLFAAGAPNPNGKATQLRVAAKRKRKPAAKRATTRRTKKAA